MNEATPLYLQVKDHILSHIHSGAWTAGTRVPSENELVESFNISRMTANRALRELADDGYVARVPGIGTFVKARTPRTSLMELRSIADEIEARGHVHSARIEDATTIQSTPSLDEEFEFRTPHPLFRLRIIHAENAVPVQLEERYVNAELVPDFLAQDFSRQTPTAYLVSVLPVDELEHTVEAVMPDASQQRLLQVRAGEPCLALHRRSWSKASVVTVVNLIYPASRYALYSRYKTNAEGKLL